MGYRQGDPNGGGEIWDQGDLDDEEKIEILAERFE